MLRERIFQRESCHEPSCDDKRLPCLKTGVSSPFYTDTPHPPAHFVMSHYEPRGAVDPTVRDVRSGHRDECSPLPPRTAAIGDRRRFGCDPSPPSVATARGSMIGMAARREVRTARSRRAAVPSPNRWSSSSSLSSRRSDVPGRSRPGERSGSSWGILMAEFRSVAGISI